VTQSQDNSPEPEIAPDYSTPAEGYELQVSALDLEARLEALLFVASTAITPHQLAEVLDETPHRVEQTLVQLSESLAGRGIRLQHTKKGVQLTSAPEAAREVQTFLQLEDIARLSRASLEALAIIAYEQPVTRPQIDAIRGVNSDSVLRTLLRHGLIEEVGRTEGPGRPILYATTLEFLGHFGLTSLDDLPALDIEGELAELAAVQTTVPTRDNNGDDD
jgi:segregation and condensation protein B